MITIINSNSNSNTLLNIFNNNFIGNAYNKADNDKKTIYEMGLLIPVDLISDVNFVVENSYNGDYLAYLKEVEIYFTTFTYEDLTTANTFYGDLWNSADCDTSTKRYLKKERKSKIFHAAALLKLIGKGGKFYCPNSLFNEFKIDKKNEQDFIKNSSIVGIDGKIISLEVATKTAEQNIAEKLNVINVMERIADKNKWTWCFITLTLTGEYHPNPSKGSNHYNGVSPKDSAKLLNNDIKKVRSLMARRGIKAGRDYHGVTSAEAHKDGCLHKHMLVFCAEENLQAIKDSFFYTFPNLNEDSFRINDRRAKASSYVFKYVMKSLTAFDKDLDIMSVTKENDPLLYSSMLNNAFRSYNSIRGFSFFGIENCLSKFRFLARNLENAKLPLIFEQLIKSNDLYELITGHYFDGVENIYVEDNGNKKFIGCKFNGVNILKNFFALLRKSVAEKNTLMCQEMAILNKNHVLNLLGVIVNPNYSRKALKDDLTVTYQENFWHNIKELGKKYLELGEVEKIEV